MACNRGARDARAGRRRGMRWRLEAKTGTGTQSLSSALAQLVFHSGEGTPRQVVVLPVGPRYDRLEGVGERSFEALGCALSAE